MQCEIDLAYHVEKGKQGVKPRSHPWTHSSANHADLYYDFKSNPELIPEVMNEWTPWNRYESVHQFYGLLRWLNLESPFETNDSRFYGPETNEDGELYCYGLMMFFFDKKRLNLSKQSEFWAAGDENYLYLPPSPHLMQLQYALYRNFLEIHPDFQWGSVELSFFPTRYKRLKIADEKKFGHEIRLCFWAFGNTEQETMANLGFTIQGIEKVLRIAAADVFANHPRYASTPPPKTSEPPLS